MNLAWEWRAFRPAGAMGALPDLVSGLRLPGETAALPVMREEDTYLLLPGCPHNLKLRDGSLEVKWRVEQRPGGYSLWADKEVWPFPLGAGPLAALAATARRPCPPRPPLESPAELVEWLRTLLPGVAVISTVKERVRFPVGQTRVEAAHVRLPGGGRWFSVCVDGYVLRSVREVVRQGRLQAWGRAVSYVGLLSEAVWWLAATGSCEVALAEDSPRSLLEKLV